MECRVPGCLGHSIHAQSLMCLYPYPGEKGCYYSVFYSCFLQTGGPGSTHTHLGEAETSLFSEKIHRTTQEKTYINGL